MDNDQTKIGKVNFLEKIKDIISKSSKPNKKNDDRELISVADYYKLLDNLKADKDIKVLGEVRQEYFNKE